MGYQIALYAVVNIFVSMKVGEAVMYGVSNKLVELDIIATYPESLTHFVLSELGRGATIAEVTGTYTGDKHKMVKIICSPRESFLIKRHLARHDPKAFVSVFPVSSVWGIGRGFTDIQSMD